MKPTNMKRLDIIAAILALVAFTTTGCRNNAENANTTDTTIDAEQSLETAAEPRIVRSLETKYARSFSVDFYDDGVAAIKVRDEENELVLLPKDVDQKRHEAPNRVFARYPLQNAYLAASSVNDFFLRLDSLDKIACTSTKAEDQLVPEMAARVASGETAYVGKYGAPEFETILGKGCDIAIESTMIYHSPKTKEQLERLGVPVFVERAIYEEEPLGRLEWIKLYGVMLGKEQEATEYFEAQRVKVEEILSKRAAADEAAQKKVALFYVTSNGYVNVRRPGDFYCKLVEIAGAQYAFDTLVDAKSSQSSISIDWESFYAAAVDADVLIYNGTVDSALTSVADLVAKNPLFADFKAVKNGEVWRSNPEMYQETSMTAEIVQEFYDAFNAPEQRGSKYLTKLN